MKSIVRLGLAAVVSGALFLSLGAGDAFAIVCSVVGKPIGAGSAVFVDDSAGGEVTITNPSGQLQGGFITFDLDGDGVGDADVFLLPTNPALEDPFELGIGELPDGAHNAGPGDDPCDGVGIDDLEACFGP